MFGYKLFLSILIATIVLAGQPLLFGTAVLASSHCNLEEWKKKIEADTKVKADLIEEAEKNREVIASEALTRFKRMLRGENEGSGKPLNRPVSAFNGLYRRLDAAKTCEDLNSVIEYAKNRLLGKPPVYTKSGINPESDLAKKILKNFTDLENELFQDINDIGEGPIGGAPAAPPVFDDNPEGYGAVAKYYIVLDLLWKVDYLNDKFLSEKEEKVREDLQETIKAIKQAITQIRKAANPEEVERILFGSDVVKGLLDKIKFSDDTIKKNFTALRWWLTRLLQERSRRFPPAAGPFRRAKPTTIPALEGFKIEKPEPKGPPSGPTPVVPWDPEDHWGKGAVPKDWPRPPDPAGKPPSELGSPRQFPAAVTPIISGQSYEYGLVNSGQILQVSSENSAVLIISAKAALEEEAYSGEVLYLFTGTKLIQLNFIINGKPIANANLTLTNVGDAPLAIQLQEKKPSWRVEENYEVKCEKGASYSGSNLFTSVGEGKNSDEAFCASVSDAIKKAKQLPEKCSLISLGKGAYKRPDTKIKDSDFTYQFKGCVILDGKERGYTDQFLKQQKPPVEDVKKLKGYQSESGVIRKGKPVPTQ